MFIVGEVIIGIMSNKKRKIKATRVNCMHQVIIFDSLQEASLFCTGGLNAMTSIGEVLKKRNYWVNVHNWRWIFIS